MNILNSCIFQNTIDNSTWKTIDSGRKQILIKFSLIATILFTFLFALLNALYFDLFDLAIADFIFVFLSLSVFIDFCLNNNLRRTSILFLLLVSVALMLYFYLIEGRYSSVLWLMVTPFFAFILLGKKDGAILTLVYIFAIGMIVLFNYNNWFVLHENGGASVSNMIGSSFFIFLLIYYYELLRDKSMEELSRLASIDILTGIYNRREFIELSRDILKNSRQEEGVFSFLLLDVDFFKNINDTYGHNCGDYVLQEMTKTIESIIPKDSIFGRVGGEEFAIVLPKFNQSEAYLVAEKIRASIESLEVRYEDALISLTVSIGIAQYEPQHIHLKEIYKEADDNLYTAKESGRNCIIITKK